MRPHRGRIFYVKDGAVQKKEAIDGYCNTAHYAEIQVRV